MLCQRQPHPRRPSRGVDAVRRLLARPDRHDPQWLYFDSKVVPYSELARSTERKICFVTIRRRGAAVLRRLNAVPASAWRRAVIDIPKRRHKNIRYLDETVRSGDTRRLRQLAVAGLGRDEPTLFLSNNFQATARELIIRYAGRNGVEDALGISVNFFHLDCLASEVRLNVDLDLALTVIANGCYRWLATQLPGFEKSEPKQAYRDSWRPEGSWRSRATGSWSGLTSVRTTRSSVHAAARSGLPADPVAGWIAGGVRVSLRTSDKGKIVIEFFTADFGVQGILDRFADRALGQDLRPLGLQPGVELVEDRPRSLGSHPVPQGDERLVVRRLALLHVALDVVEQADPGQRLMRPLRVAGPRLVELPPRVHQAPDLDDRRPTCTGRRRPNRRRPGDSPGSP